MKIPLEPGDEVAATSTMYVNGSPVTLGVTRQGRMYEIAWTGSDYKINVL